MGLALNWSRLYTIKKAVFNVPEKSSPFSSVKYAFTLTPFVYFQLGTPIYLLFGLILVPFPDAIGFLWLSTFAFFGLRFRFRAIKSRFLGIIAMAEESYYDKIVIEKPSLKRRKKNRK